MTASARLTADLPQQVQAARVTWGRTLGMLFARTLLFAAFQALFALGMTLAGSTAAWDASNAWWPVAALLTNLVCIALLIVLFRSEGKSFWSLFRVEPGTWRKDMLPLLLALLITGPIGFLPGTLLSQALYGDPQAASLLMIQPLPLWGALLSILFPLTIIFAEIPLYFAYVQPRLEALSGSRTLAVLLPALMLSLQHATLPLRFDPAFIIYRAFMFLLFALMLSLLLRWRPRLLPYFVIVHGLMDLSVVVFLF